MKSNVPPNKINRDWVVTFCSQRLGGRFPSEATGCRAVCVVGGSSLHFQVISAVQYRGGRMTHSSNKPSNELSNKPSNTSHPDRICFVEFGPETVIIAMFQSTSPAPACATQQRRGQCVSTRC